MALFVGIDVSKDKLAVALADTGTQADALYLGTFKNTPASVAKLLKKRSGRGRVCACYEAGPTGYGLYDRYVRMTSIAMLSLRRSSRPAPVTG